MKYHVTPKIMCRTTSPKHHIAPLTGISRVHWLSPDPSSLRTVPMQIKDEPTSATNITSLHETSVAQLICLNETDMLAIASHYLPAHAHHTTLEPCLCPF